MGKQYVISQYHSVYSATGMYMIRKGDWKLIVYAAQRPRMRPWEPQLFNITADPWEQHNLASSYPTLVENLRLTLAGEVDVNATDKEKKAFDAYLFDKYWYGINGGARNCSHAMAQVYKGFDSALDAPAIEA